MGKLKRILVFCDNVNVLTAPEGTFSDKTIERDYLPSISCTWRIEPNPAVDTITINFNQLQMYNIDYITVQDGSNPPSFSNYFSDVIFPPNQVNRMTIFSSTVLISFVTDPRYQRSGFEITYTSGLFLVCVYRLIFFFC